MVLGSLYPSAPRRTHRLARGDKLGKFEVIRLIAVGGMAELYLARTLGIEGFEKPVVLKRILPQYATSATFVNMFLNEARLAATLHHPNIAQVYDIGLEDGDYFFSMEYVHGEDVEHILATAEEQGIPLSMDASLTLITGLCAGLHHAHEQVNASGEVMGIVHRDVSPSNILVSHDGSVKLVDFGIARTTARAQSADRPDTMQGALKGKIAYMSPEQCRAKPLDRRSDLYSIGTILYELTTGRPPFTGESEYQVLSQIANEDVPPPSTIVPGYPAELERIVLRALERDVDRRYATALELQTDLEDFAHETRFRISPLVLSRLMSSLFSEPPATPNPDDDSPVELGDSAYDGGGDTNVGAPQFPIAPETERTSDAMLPPPPDTTDEVPYDQMMGIAIGDDSLPRRPTPYPMATELMKTAPGSLVTAGGSYGATAGGNPLEQTLRVRVPKRPRPTPTAFVRTSSRSPLLVFVVLVAIAGAVAAWIALRGDDPRGTRIEMQVVPTPPAEPVD